MSEDAIEIITFIGEKLYVLFTIIDVGIVLYLVIS